MKKLIIILGFVCAITAMILAATPLSQMAFIPGILALIFGIISLYITKQNQGSKKSIQLIFLMTIIALTVTIYKSVFNTIEVGDTQELQDKQVESQEEAIKELDDLEIEDLE